MGDLRNVAIELSRGQAIVNMDNDDFYHPNYVRYVVGHMIDGPFSELRLAPTAVAVMNPDGTVEITANAANARYGGHIMSFMKAGGAPAIPPSFVISLSASRYGNFDIVLDCFPHVSQLYATLPTHVV